MQSLIFLWEDAHSHEDAVYRRQPCSARECAEAHSFFESNYTAVSLDRFIHKFCGSFPACFINISGKITVSGIHIP